jgi:hypothetical protein
MSNDIKPDAELSYVVDKMRLLDCPFCGGNAESKKPTARPEDEYKEWTRFYPIVRCSSCGSLVEGIDHDWSCKSAVDKWNKRAT